MRLWHYELIPVLPQNILIRLWHDCEAIGSNLERKGTTGDVKCDKILDFDWKEFREYCIKVRDTMIGEHCKVNDRLAGLLLNRIEANKDKFHPAYILDGGVYKNWHDLDYFDLCYMLIKELYGCGVISERDWIGFNDGYHYRRSQFISTQLSPPRFRTAAQTALNWDRYAAMLDSISAIGHLEPLSIQAGSFSTVSIPAGITLSASAPDTIISSSSPTEIPF